MPGLAGGRKVFLQPPLVLPDEKKRRLKIFSESVWLAVSNLLPEPDPVQTPPKTKTAENFRRK